MTTLSRSRAVKVRKRKEECSRLLLLAVTGGKEYVGAAGSFASVGVLPRSVKATDQHPI